MISVNTEILVYSRKCGRCRCTLYMLCFCLYMCITTSIFYFFFCWILFFFFCEGLALACLCCWRLYFNYKKIWVMIGHVFVFVWYFRNWELFSLTLFSFLIRVFLFLFLNLVIQFHITMFQASGASNESGRSSGIKWGTRGDAEKFGAERNRIHEAAET